MPARPTALTQLASNRQGSPLLAIAAHRPDGVRASSRRMDAERFSRKLSCFSEFLRYNQRRNSLICLDAPCLEIAMPRPSSPQPTEVEMQILRVLWDLGPSPVRAIHRLLEAG